MGYSLQFKDGVKVAVGLLRGGRAGSGLTLRLTSGPIRQVSAEIDSLWGEVLLIHGLGRLSEMRPQREFFIYVDESKGGYKYRLDRVMGLSMLDTIPNPTRCVDYGEVSGIEDLEQALIDSLAKAGSVEAFAMVGINYRNNQFAVYTTEKTAPVSPWWSLRKPRDLELQQFIENTIDDAIDFIYELKQTKLSLWFTIGEGTNTVYVTSSCNKAGFKVEVNDRASCPWKENCIKRSGLNEYAFRSIVSDYIVRKFSFKSSEVSVYINCSN